MFAAVRAVLFDAVGTLIRADPPVAAAYHAAGRRFGSALTVDEIARRFRTAMLRHGQAGDAHGRREESFAGGLGKSRLRRPPTDQQGERRRWRRIVAEVFDDVSDAEGALFEALWEHFAQSSHWRLFADAPEAWRRLQSLGLILGVASNFDERLPAICRGLEPLARCPRLFFSSRIGHPKPAPEFFQAIERSLDLAPEQILLVGDDLVNDYLGAKTAGWNALLLDRQSSREANNSSICSLMQLAELVSDRRFPSADQFHDR